MRTIGVLSGTLWVDVVVHISGCLPAIKPVCHMLALLLLLLLQLTHVSFPPAHRLWRPLLPGVVSNVKAAVLH